jgi:hypothetical protein
MPSGTHALQNTRHADHGIAAMARYLHQALLC